MILASIQAEMLRQVELHPVRPKHPYHWAVIFGEEVFEALTEISRLAQEQAESASLDARLAASKRLRTELIQVAATAAAWAETLPAGETE